MFDAEGRLVVSNRRYAEIYGLSDDPPVPGMSLQDIRDPNGLTVADTRRLERVGKALDEFLDKIS